jgi:hypothetical protein
MRAALFRRTLLPVQRESLASRMGRTLPGSPIFPVSGVGLDLSLRRYQIAGLMEPQKGGSPCVWRAEQRRPRAADSAKWHAS